MVGKVHHSRPILGRLSHRFCHSLGRPPMAVASIILHRSALSDEPSMSPEPGSLCHGA